MMSYIKSIIFFSCIFVGGNYVCGTVNNKWPEPVPGRTIIATYRIDEGHANQDVRIINDGSTGLAKTRTGIGSIEICKLDNNNEPQVEHICGNGEYGEIPKDHVFGTPGVYEIYYYFKEGVTIIDMSYMFFQCYSLTTLDLSSFDTSNVTNMSHMFFQCYSLTSLDFSKFNTQKVTDMSHMFSWCPSLTSLNLSDFNTEKVTDMSYMFSECSSLTSLNLSNFNTTKVTKMPEMFSGCTSLKTLDLSNFNTDSANGRYCLFEGCSSLEEVTTNDGYIKSLCKDKKVKVLPPNKKEVNIEIVDISNNLDGSSQSQSNSNCWCCPCWKNR